MFQCLKCGFTFTQPAYKRCPVCGSDALKITLFEQTFRELGRRLDEIASWIINALLELPEEQRKKLLEELSRKEE